MEKSLKSIKNPEAVMQKVKKNPFTLIEIMAVIGIIAVLAGLTVGVSSIVMDRAAEAKTKSAIKMLEMAIMKYRDTLGHYPVKPGYGMFFARYDKSNPANDDPIWKFLDEKFKNQNTVEFTGTDGNTYCRFVDGCGNPLVYRSPGYFNKGKFDLGSVGKDKRFGSNESCAEFTESAIDTNFTNYQNNFGKGDDIVNFANNAEF